tara:strand:- start:86 stop:208 length:123 start_codon:yes stop_codon:yes gene_type:complete
MIGLNIPSDEQFVTQNTTKSVIETASKYIGIIFTWEGENA